MRAALADGAEQLVVIGGGLDTLALRIAEDEPSRHVFELDHPDSQAAKRRGLDALPPRPANFHLEGVDLAQHALPDVLARIQAFEAAKPTVFVAEGLLMYLDHDDVKRLLDGIANTAPAHSRIVFTFLSADELGRPVIGHAAARTRFLLKLYGEPLRSGIHPERLGEYLRERGFALREHWDERRLLARYLPERDAARTPLLDWEYAAIADRGSGDSRLAPHHDDGSAESHGLGQRDRHVVADVVRIDDAQDVRAERVRRIGAHHHRHSCRAPTPRTRPGQRRPPREVRRRTRRRVRRCLRSHEGRRAPHRQETSPSASPRGRPRVRRAACLPQADRGSATRSAPRAVRA
ncbi:MAG: class I SAM-dependent methyltransferase [Planctomycetes bacterium]|nr:class I SAM-dependent methyltransferase [Planctomycetota bacterium]